MLFAIFKCNRDIFGVSPLPVHFTLSLTQILHHLADWIREKAKKEVLK